MVNQLLGFARRSTLSLESVHLGQLLNDLAAVLRRVLPADIELLVFADEDLPEVSADGHAVEQILLNLVNNARDAMPDGGVLRLETSCTWISDAHREAIDKLIAATTANTHSPQRVMERSPACVCPPGSPRRYR